MELFEPKPCLREPLIGPVKLAKSDFLLETQLEEVSNGFEDAKKTFEKAELNLLSLLYRPEDEECLDQEILDKIRMNHGLLYSD